MKILTLVLVLVVGGSGVAGAQSFEDDGELFIPPELVVDGRPNRDSYFYLLRDRFGHLDYLLPAVFFDRPGDITIPERYDQFESVGKTRAYVDSGAIKTQLNHPSRMAGPLRKYREILNIIGYRLRQHPDLVVGLRAGFSTEPGENETVARERAVVIRDYLASIWSIDTNRLPLLPPESIADSADNPLHQQEARYVSFESDDWRLVRPVDYSEDILVPLDTRAKITVRPNVDPDRISSIELRVYDAKSRDLIGHAVLSRQIDTTPYTIEIIWHPSDGEEALGKDGFVVEARVVMTNGRYHASDRLHIRTVISDERERSLRRPRTSESLLIPFFNAYDTSLSTLHKQLLTDFYRTYLDTRNGDRESRRNFPTKTAVAVYGTNEFSENPGLDPITVAALLPGLREDDRLKKQNKLEAYPPTDSLEVVPIHPNSPRQTAGQIDLYQPDNAQRAPSLNSDSRYANARARSVVRYLIDSIGVALDTVRTNERSHLNGTSRLDDGVPGTFEGRGPGIEFLRDPEERIFRRSVFLQFGLAN